MGRIDDEFVRRQETLLTALKLPVSVPKLNTEQLMAAMVHDKKTEHGKLRFVLPTRLGHVELVDGVAAADVQAALEG
jgi:3-dehydroquinate synthase